jgi:hypothetical protein
MNNVPTWKYALLAGAAMIIVMVVVYLRVAASVTSTPPALLPLTPSPTLRLVQAKLVPIKRLTMTNGAPLYIITGKFVTTPTYNAENILQGDFVIDGDPLNQSIPVVMTKETGEIAVVKSQGSFDGGTNTVVSEDTESFREGLTAGEPIQLRIYPVATVSAADEKAVEKVLDGIIAGNWSLPNDFTLHPPMLGVIQ